MADTRRFFCVPPSALQLVFGPLPLTNLDAYTDEDLERALAHTLALAQGEVLNDAEVQKFYQLYEEIQRRVLSVTAT